MRVSLSDFVIWTATIEFFLYFVIALFMRHYHCSNYLAVTKTAQLVTLSFLSLWEGICDFLCVDSIAHLITTVNYQMSQFCLLFDNLYCNHIHIHTYTFTALFKHSSIFTLLFRHKCTQRHIAIFAQDCSVPRESKMVINNMNYLRNFQVCKNWLEERR